MTIDISQYNVPQVILEGIVKLFNEAIQNGHDIHNMVYSDKPEIQRFIDDCVIALS